jgi:hypothetical protein
LEGRCGVEEGDSEDDEYSEGMESGAKQREVNRMTLVKLVMSLVALTKL